MTLNEARAALTQLQEKLIAYGHASSLFYGVFFGIKGERRYN